MLPRTNTLSDKCPMFYRTTENFQECKSEVLWAFTFHCHCDVWAIGPVYCLIETKLYSHAFQYACVGHTNYTVDCLEHKAKVTCPVLAKTWQKVTAQRWYSGHGTFVLCKFMDLQSTKVTCHMSHTCHCYCVTYERFRSATKKHFYELAFMNWSRDCLRSHDSFLATTYGASVIK